MRIPRHRLVISAIVVTAVVGAGLGAGQAIADTHRGFQHHGARRTGMGFARQPAPGAGRSASRGAPSQQAPSQQVPSQQVPSSQAPSGGSTQPGGHSPSTQPPTSPAFSSPGVPAGTSAPVAAALVQINQLRAANGQAPLSLSDGLNASARAHNQQMINGGGLSHQCPGEASLGDRISAQGVRWMALAENIGKSGRVADNADAITKAATGLTTAMYNETAPNDGHRRNLLGTAYTHIGIDIVRDSSGTVWMTQDFSN